ncbi:hypothetical protein [Streptomyces aureocirculatus]|uniref:hypothetical protein n=1 Tax=Streptomyces aureocirculatus TaxID=67275 RepID=UPI0007C5AD22|nr:hypothetical protein [Streptomyces aureocirculatus]
MDKHAQEAPLKPRPDYPPKTPPPPKKPVSPPAPNPPTQNTAPVRVRTSVVIRDRRAANWALENAPWSPRRAAEDVVRKVGEWGLLNEKADKARTLAQLTRLLTEAALTDGGRRITVHVTDRHQHLLVMAVSHVAQTGAAVDREFLREVTSLGIVECGMDADGDEPGNRRWALLAL